MDNVVPFIAPKPKAKVCTFCKKDGSKVKSLFASNITDACICGDCIRHAKSRLMENTDAMAVAVPAIES